MTAGGTVTPSDTVVPWPPSSREFTSVGKLRLLPGLQAGQRDESANDVAKVVGGRFVTGLGAHDGANAIVDASAHRQPGHRRQLLLDFRGNDVAARHRLDVGHDPGVAVVEVA